MLCAFASHCLGSRRYTSDLRELWNEMDDDDSGFISLDEVDAQAAHDLKTFHTAICAKSAAQRCCNATSVVTKRRSHHSPRPRNVSKGPSHSKTR